jgi:hypothetical protein
MEKRKHLRIAMDNLSVDVSDGVGFFQGKVADISRFGVCMTDLPKHLSGDAKKMTIVVSGTGSHFKMEARPQWYTHGGVMKSVGVEFLIIPKGWAKFVMNLEPVWLLADDIWAGIHI